MLVVAGVQALKPEPRYGSSSPLTLDFRICDRFFSILFRDVLFGVSLGNCFLGIFQFIVAFEKKDTQTHSVGDAIGQKA